MHNINITFSSHSQTQQRSKSKLQKKLLNQRKTTNNIPQYKLDPRSLSKPKHNPKP